MRRILQRRLTISPSPAINTSSPCERKIFFGSPGWFAKPKNFSGMGACWGGGGRWYFDSSAFARSVVPLVTGVGGASACETKMFLPDPSYFSFSVAASSSNLRVGSRLCGARAFLAEEPPAEDRREAERVGVVPSTG